MDWLYLVLAGIFEVGWPVGIKLAQTGYHKPTFIAFSVICLSASGWLLWLAQKTIAIGTAYAVWTGIGAAGTFLIGLFFFNDPNSLLRWAGIALIIGGVTLLKLGST
jgi:quaternary ammonium compound-resistance protein SugE